MPDTPDEPAAGRVLPPADAEAAREDARQRGADAVISAAAEAQRLGSQTGGWLPAAVPGARNLAGLPETAYDRAGLYGYGQAPRRPGVRAPEIPEGETDSFDLPRLPYMLVRRPPEREAEAGE